LRFSPSPVAIICMERWVIASPLFGQANQMYGQVNGDGFSENASNRRLELQVRSAF